LLYSKVLFLEKLILFATDQKRKRDKDLGVAKSSRTTERDADAMLFPCPACSPPPDAGTGPLLDITPHADFSVCD
jgi:hypothetical protein